MPIAGLSVLKVISRLLDILTMFEFGSKLFFLYASHQSYSVLPRLASAMIDERYELAGKVQSRRAPIGRCYAR